jgi:cytochrome oxidase assembly protein ShyY1
VNGWRFALNRRWLGYLAFVVAFAIACSFLALWQLSRREEARAEIELVESNWDRAPQQLASVLTSLDAFDPQSKWMPVTLSGHYVADEQLLVRGRPLDGVAGFEVLVPFELDDGTIFIVDRGWLPAGNEQDEPDSVPPAPRGDVTVVARLKAGEPIVAGRSAPEGQVATIHLPSIAETIDAPMYTGAYGLLDSEEPAPAARPTAAVKPVPDEGPHLSYAFQWFVFGILAFVGLAWALRQEFRIRNAAEPAEQARAAHRARKAAARKPTDAQVEDALLDEQ